MNVDLKELFEDSNILFIPLTHQSYPSFHTEMDSEIFFVPKDIETIEEVSKGGD
jgi:hypothetical protein